VGAKQLCVAGADPAGQRLVEQRRQIALRSASTTDPSARGTPKSSKDAP